MTDERLWAFTVSPARTAEQPPDPLGGALNFTPVLSAALSAALVRPRDNQWTQVAFRAEETTDSPAAGRRSSPARETSC